MLEKLFPNLFEAGVNSVNYGDINAKRENDGVILTGWFLHTFLHELCKTKGVDADKIDDLICIEKLANDKLLLNNC